MKVTDVLLKNGMQSVVKPNNDKSSVQDFAPDKT